MTTTKKRTKLIIGAVIGLLVIVTIFYGLVTTDNSKQVSQAVYDEDRPSKPLPPANIYLYAPDNQSAIISGEDSISKETRVIAAKIIYNLAVPKEGVGNNWRGQKAKDNESPEIDTVEELEEKYVVLTVRMIESIEVTTDQKKQVKTDRFSIVLGGKYKGTVFVREPDTEKYSVWQGKSKHFRQLAEVFRAKEAEKQPTGGK